ncbi:MAG: YabP/YqfC family sporulation protein [Clostridia bacterium]|nr:YabP/YqfC family sporulation protein [Clostridia bacterium]
MNLILQLIKEMGADTANAITLCMGECAYFKCVKGVALLSSQKITVVCNKKLISVTGENLTVAEYFQGDILIKGDIYGVQIEKS